MTRRRRAPALEPCPRCQLPLEAGTGPGGRAWHDCDFVLRLTEDVSIESVQRLLLTRIRDAATHANPKELVALLNALRESQPARTATGEGDGEGSGALADWLKGGAPRPW